jgi:dipeptidyl aminopeptidase/acylaminoacyl peptidase
VQFDYARFLNVRRAYGPSFSPDGRRIAFVMDLTGVPQIFSVGVGGGWPEQLTFTQERVGLVQFSPSADEMVVASDVGGDERVQLWRLSARGEQMTALTYDPTAMHPFGGWSPDGQHLAWVGNERDPRCFDVFVDGRRVLETDGDYAIECWRPATFGARNGGAALVVSRHEGSFDNTLFELDLASGRARELTPHEPPARFERAQYAPDGQLLYLTDRDGDFMTLPGLDLGWDVEDIALSPDGRQLALHVNVDGFSELYLRDVATRRMRQIALPPGVVSRGFVGNWHDTLAWSPDGQLLAFSFTGARETQNVWLADVPTGQARRLTSATQAGIPPEALAEPTLVRYPTFDGRQIPAFLYAPPEPTGRAIVLIHGGPESQSQPGFDPTIQYFVHRGYVVLTPNVRGSTGYGKAYAHLDDVELRMDSVADAKAAAEYLAASGLAHPRRIAAMGQSYGGFMVLASLCTYPETWAAGVDLYGIADFVTFLQNTHPHRRAHREAEYGSLARDRAVLERISPLRLAGSIRAPLMAVHGEKDPRVPIGETDQIVAALQARGIPTEFVRLPDEGHGIVKLPNRLRVWPAVADFLDRHLGRD